MWWSIFLCFVSLAFVLLFGISCFLFVKTRQRNNFKVHPATSDSVILISGCDTGIGRATTEKFIAEGYHVLATVFTKTGEGELKQYAESLRKAANLTTCFTDITKEESVGTLHETLENLLAQYPTKNLVGLVNNAGIALGGPIEVQPFKLFRKQLDVNLFGHVLMSQTFIPFLRESQGRLVNTVSLAGRAAAAGMGAYAASKFAMEAVTDSLRQELAQWKISVSAIEPGFIRTPMVENNIKQIDSLWDELNPNAKTLYSRSYERAKRGGQKVLRYCISPTNVADAIFHAITSPKPKTRYLVGNDALIIGNLWSFLPDRLKDALGELLVN